MSVVRNLSLSVAAFSLAAAGAQALGDSPASGSVPAALDVRMVAANAPSSADDHVNHVVAISVDGLSSKALRALSFKGAPNLFRMMNEGICTLNARTAVESTSTLPNHTSMLTSRHVAREAGGHGVTFNNDNQKTTVHRAAGEYVHSVFDAVHDRGRSTALYTSKEKFALFKRTWRKHGARDTVGRNNGRNKLDTYVFRRNEAKIVRMVRKDLANGPAAFTFIHLSNTDKQGHATGYMGAKYLKAVQVADRRVGKIVAKIRNTPSLYEDTVVILTSDHGGKGFSHSDPTRLTNFRIPFAIWGRGIGFKSPYVLNPEYKRPARKQIGRDGRQPIRNGDLGNLATDLLDVSAIEGSQLNLPRDFDVFPG